MFFDMICGFFQDALFAAIAAIGFAAISNPPRNAYAYCAAIAATGHSVRYLIMQPVLLSPRAKVPAETFLFPSLLPMIPGIYAYKAFGGIVMCLGQAGEDSFMHSLYLFASNGMTCFFIILGMVVGATMPIFLMKRVSFRATRRL